MNMRKLRRKLNSALYRKGVWVGRDGKYGPTIRGGTYSMRLVRLKQPTKYYGLGNGGASRMSPPSFKRRGLPANYIDIAKANGFEPGQRPSGSWDVYDMEVGDRHHDLHRSKSRAWISCYRAAVERQEWQRPYAHAVRT